MVFTTMGYIIEKGKNIFQKKYLILTFAFQKKTTGKYHHNFIQIGIWEEKYNSSNYKKYINQRLTRVPIIEQQKQYTIDCSFEVIFQSWYHVE